MIATRGGIPGDLCPLDAGPGGHGASLVMLVIEVAIDLLIIGVSVDSFVATIPGPGTYPGSVGSNADVATRRQFQAKGAAGTRRARKAMVASSRNS